jgi:hypothetical protein
MATLTAADQLTPLEVAKRFGNKDSILVIENLAKVNEMLLDASVFEASDGTINRTTQRTAQPTGTRRMYNEGITPHASQTKQIEDMISMLEDYSDVDADLADHSPNKAAFLQSEDEAFLQGMALTQQEDLIYGNHTSDLAQINGLAVRMPSLAAGSVFDMTSPDKAGAGAGTSVFMVKWGKTFTHLFYPRGHEGVGIKREFRGKVDAVKVAGAILPCYRTFFSAQFGLSVRHPDSIKRVANILNATMPSGLAILTNIIAARNKMPPGEGNIVIYCNSAVKTALDVYAMTKSNMCYYADDPWGKKVTMFQDMRIRQVESIVNTETLLT